MRTSGLFETTRYIHEIKSIKDPLYICFISDTHWLADGFSHKAWDTLKQWDKENGKQTIYMFNGDYLEWANARTRHAIEGVVAEDFRKHIDRWVNQDLKAFAEEISFVIGRTIGVGEGNHGQKFDDGTNDSQSLAAMLRVPFLGVRSASQVTIDYNGRRASFLIDMFHGLPSNATTTGGPINAVERMTRQVEGALIYAQGDNHQRWAVPTDPKMRFVVNHKTGHLEAREHIPWLVRTGGFVKSFEKGKKSYVVDKGGGGRSLGPMILQLDPKLDSPVCAEIVVRSAIYI